MNDFIRCNKLTGIHWLNGPVDQLTVKIRLKTPDDIISLPKFDDYANDTSNSNIGLEHNVEEFSFKWQEKYFSACEVQRYKDVHNCLTENELKYHELIKKKNITPSTVFSYVHEDYYMPLPQEKRRKLNSLFSCFESLSLDDAVGRIEDAFGGKTLSERHLFKSQEDVCDEEQWMSMHIIFDNSEYNEETVLIKQEATLLSLYLNTTHNYLITTPDMNNLETSPYVVETNAGELLGFQYEVGIEFGGFGEPGDGDELVTLLTKLYKKWEKKHKVLINFVTPPLGRMQYHVSIDVLSATGFEMENLYIEYNIKLPEGIQCSDTLHGRTHVSEPADVNEESVWNYGHLVELCLEMDAGVDIPPLNIYFEAISVDFWHRHRTEGYAHLPLHLSPGVTTEVLRCVRPDEMFGAQDRRFFIGGCHLIQDLEVLSKPGLQNGEYTYTGTGTILVRATTISQSTLPTAFPTGVHHETGTASVLLGAEAALRKYKRARARLAEATTRAD